MSAARTSPSMVAASSTLATTRWKSPPLRLPTLRYEPVERSSTATTASPPARAASARWEPMKPAPPVTRMVRIGRTLLRRPAPPPQGDQHDGGQGGRLPEHESPGDPGTGLPDRRQQGGDRHREPGRP